MKIKMEHALNILIPKMQKYGECMEKTHLDWKVWVSSCFSSPFGFMVNILTMGMPTARYAQTS